MHLHRMLWERDPNPLLLPKSYSVDLFLNRLLDERPYAQPGVYFQREQAAPSSCCW